MIGSIAAIVPTFRRPDDLARCLEALGSQDRAFDEVCVVTRPGDPGIQVASSAGVRVLELDEPGVLAAMAAGARATSAEVLCFTDDDAVAPASWSRRLCELLASSELVGGAGGRDRVVHADGTEETPGPGPVGTLSWYGRHRGRHHLGTGEVRDVAFLKGVNCAYRRRALALPDGLRGQGAQAHFEIAVGRRLRASGWRLRYDPSLVVEHRPAPRQGEDQRSAPSPRAVADAAYNLVVAVGGASGLARVAYAVALGDAGAPGLGRGAVAALRGERATLARVVPSIRGTLAGGLEIARRRPLRFETFGEPAG